MTDKPTDPLRSALAGLKRSFKPRHRRVLAMGGAAVIVIVGLGAFGLLPPVRQVQTAGMPVLVAANDSAHSTPRMLESSAPFSFADLVERVSPAVVSITVEETSTANGDGLQNVPEEFRQFFRQFGQIPQQQSRPAMAAGSGFIIDKSGYIVTNNHVIKDAKKITVKMKDGRTFTAKLIGADPATDVALLKINGDKPFPSVEFGDDKTLRVGDWVVAVGNPFGLSNTVTAGIVSSLGRDIESSQPYTNFIQIDAPINPGNSGGPTFNLRGQVVGMNSMIFSRSGGSLGIGFAIPSSVIQDVVAQLKATGHVTRGWLGVSIQSVTPDIAASLGLKDQSGALVAQVVPGSPADKAGFQQGDIIRAINGKTVKDAHGLTQEVAAIPTGKETPFTVDRGGKTVTLRVTIGTRPSEQQLASDSEGGGPVSPSSTSAAGLALSSLTPSIRRQYNLGDSVNEGVVITKVDPSSDAATKGLQPGDVVLKLNNRAVKSPADFVSGVAEAKKAGRKSVLLLVARQSGDTGFVAINLSNT